MNAQQKLNEASNASDPKRKLIVEMLRVLADLGNSPTARIDARAWHRRLETKATKVFAPFDLYPK